MRWLFFCIVLLSLLALTPVQAQENCAVDGSCPQTATQESSDLNLINNPPLVVEIPQITTPFNLDLKLYAVDPENQPMTFVFESTLTSTYSSGMASCSLQSSLLSCLSGSTSGFDKLTILVSDGMKTTPLAINIFNEAASAVSINLPPQANAGQDISAFPGHRVLLDATKTTDPNNDLVFQESSFIWKLNNEELGRGLTLLQRFDKPGAYTIDLEVTDAAGLLGKDQAVVFIQEKTSCRNTTAIYFPLDTSCQTQWPTQEGELIVMNTRSPSCSLVEVCSPELDPMIEEVLDCCDGTPLKDPKKSQACNFANKYSQGSNKRCQALYAVKAVGDSAIYMQDYFEAEMCCYGVEAICNKKTNFYKALPTPRTNKPSSQQLLCKTTPDNHILGTWLSDSIMSYNNIALQDVHAAATLTVLGTGTCVDYSVALVTLLRKLGYSNDEVFIAEASNHAYTIIRLPLDRKYHIVDTTGNKAPSIVLGNVPQGYPYCENIQNCYNDLGKQLCPELKSIVGCEGIRESFTRKTSRFSFKAQKLVKGVTELFVEEVKR